MRRLRELAAFQTGSLPCGWQYFRLCVGRKPLRSTAAQKAMAEFDSSSGSWIFGRYESVNRSEEHTSELQSLMRISYAVFCLNKKNTHISKRNIKQKHNK